MSEKFINMLIEAIDGIEEAKKEVEKEVEKEENKSRRGRPKKQVVDLKAIEDEFKAAQDDEKKLNKLIMKYGDKEDGDIAALVRKYMKYDKKKAEDYLSRDPEAENSIVK